MLKNMESFPNMDLTDQLLSGGTLNSQVSLSGDSDFWRSIFTVAVWVADEVE